MNRRGLLKLFGAGAAIVPLIGGVPEVASAAKLIEVPKLEPIVSPSEVVSLPPFNKSGKVGIVVTITEENGKRYQFSADTFVMETNVERVDVTDHTGYRSPFRSFIPGPSYLEWQLRGRMIASGSSAKLTVL